MKICLSWKEFYLVMMEQNRRMGCECLVFLFYYEYTPEDIWYDYFWVTYESLENRVKLLRSNGYKVIPITTNAKREHMESIHDFIEYYLVGQEIRNVRYPMRGEGFMVEFEPNCRTIDDLNNHFVEVMLQMI